MERISDLMPQGKPDFKQVRDYPSIEQLKSSMNPAAIKTVLYLLVKDFSNSLNLKRGMSEEQMYEVAAMLYDKCDTFRVEDYVMMFTLAKRGELTGSFYQAMDISIISDMLNTYWAIRSEAGEKIYEQEQAEYENKIKDKRKDSEGLALVDAMRENMLQWQIEEDNTKRANAQFEKDREERIKQIQKELSEQNLKNHAKPAH